MTLKKLSRTEIIRVLLARDGTLCYHPNCNKEFRRIDGQVDNEDVTIDHWIPLAKGGTWDLDNLRLMHKPCNAQKGDKMPLSDRELPESVRSRNLSERRLVRSQRAEVCERCQSGRSLGPDEVCSVCGSGPKPERYPRWAKAQPKECDHAMFWCWACTLGLYERKSTMEMLISGPE